MELTHKDIISYTNDFEKDKLSFGISIGRRLTRHMHPDLEILYVLSGNICFNIEEEQRQIKTGDIVFMNSMDIHSITDANYDCTFFVITAAPSFLEPFRNLIKSSKIKQPFVTSRDEDQTAYRFYSDLFSKLYQEYCRRDGYYREYMQGLGYLLFSSIPRYLGLEEKNRSAPPDKMKLFMTRVYDYLETNIGEPFSLKMVADAVSLSPSRFSHLFKEFMGTSFAKYLAKYRIQFAKELLIAQPNANITDICDRSGFHSLQHFNRTFKAEYGMSPSVYRKKYLVSQ